MVHAINNERTALMSYYTIIQCDKCGTSLYYKGIISEETTTQKTLQYNWRVTNNQIICDECISERKSIPSKTN